MNGYVFISNSTKPSEQEQKSRKPVGLSNVSRPCLKAALNMGYDVYLGVNRENPDELECELPVHMFDSHTYRSITALEDNWIAFRNLCRVIKAGKVSVIHCNTPVGGMIGRIVGKIYGVPRVIYTAHGFHFFKGAPLFNNTILKWAEQIMAHWTDVVITMNEEDYRAAKKLKLRKNGKVYKVHGVGIDLKQYADVKVDKQQIRDSLGLAESDVVCIAAGDLVKRKNYSIAIEAIAFSKLPNVHYLICGVGPEEDNLRALARELDIEEQIHFLGFRTDIKELFMISDIFLFTSLQEGLPRSLMEAMACGLPCVVSKVRGNVDLITDNKGGFLCNPNSVQDFSKAIRILEKNDEMMAHMRSHNLTVIKDFDVSIVEKEIETIYKDVLN